MEQATLFHAVAMVCRPTLPSANCLPCCRWVDAARRLQVKANADSPEDAAMARKQGAQVGRGRGVGKVQAGRSRAAGLLGPQVAWPMGQARLWPGLEQAQATLIPVGLSEG